MDKNDIVDVVAAVLSSAPARSSGGERPVTPFGEAASRTYKSGVYASGYLKPFTALKSGRPFLSEYDVKTMLSSNPREITVPKNAIISPLAEDLIQEKNVKINYV
ncbi:MAG: hypothetical protein CVU77_07670 [Elusimicrobia bacterium HGW-Elusimicrobia-1]|jgi:hypothetical protein|nr:MAG: hypothetical protein CVU77_07670 [Elusimicrobia bacterium HGW-Elusimicrobia-1]